MLRKSLFFVLVVVIDFGLFSQITFTKEIDRFVFLNNSMAMGSITLNVGGATNIITEGDRFVLNRAAHGIAKEKHKNINYTIYNADFSVFKDVVIDTTEIERTGRSLGVLVTTHLFNNDDQIEFLCSYKKTDGTAITKVVDDKGVEIFSSNEYCIGIQMINGKYYLLNYKIDKDATSFYQLEGSLPFAQPPINRGSKFPEIKGIKKQTKRSIGVVVMPGFTTGKTYHDPFEYKGIDSEGNPPTRKLRFTTNFGITYRQTLKGKMFIETGLYYSNRGTVIEDYAEIIRSFSPYSGYNTSTTAISDIYMYDYYLTLPVLLGLNFGSYFISLGPTIARDLYQKLVRKGEINDTRYIGRGPNSVGTFEWNSGFELNFGIHYPLTKIFDLKVDLGTEISNIKHENNYSDKYYNFELGIGLNWNILAKENQVMLQR